MQHNMPNICLIDNNSSMLLNFRKSFIIELVKKYDVYVICPLHKSDEKKLMSLGVKACINNNFLKRQSINPYNDYKLYNFYKEKISEINPNIVFNYTIKCSIWGSLAAKKVGVHNIYSMITGLGYSFTESNNLNLKKIFISNVVKVLYKKSIFINTKIFFLNPDDKIFFINNKLANNQQTIVLNGEGVDLDYFSYFDSYPQVLTVIVISRLLKEKGILEYFEAAKILNKKYGNKIIFKLAGPIDDNPSSITQKKLEEIKNSGIIDYLGEVSDVRSCIKDSSLLLLSSYREGTPRCILEAMSMGRPIITTNTPGCRETVIEGDNGYLVSVKNIDSLVTAIEKFIDNPDLIKKMGKRSREISEEKYNIHEVNKKVLMTILA